jgi:hypothetical protein
MGEPLTAGPVSTASPGFVAIVHEHLERGEVVVIVIRYANSGGYKEDAFAKTTEAFDELLRTLRQRTSVTVFFERAFEFRGVADDTIRKRTLEFIKIVRLCRDGEVVCVVRRDLQEGILKSEQIAWLLKPSDADAWFAQNQSAEVLIGTLSWWEDDCDDFVTAYVPDSDGVVRLGAY